MMPIADFGPEMAAVLVPMMVFAIPIVAILTGHQRKMAELMRDQHNQQNNLLGNPEIQTLRSEIYELKDLVRQQTIMIDDLSMAQRAIQTRLQDSESSQTTSTI